MESKNEKDKQVLCNERDGKSKNNNKEKHQFCYEREKTSLTASSPVRIKNNIQISDKHDLRHLGPGEFVPGL